MRMSDRTQGDVLDRQAPARLQHAVQFGIHPRPVLDIHHHILRPDDVEPGIGEGQRQRRALAEIHLAGKAHAPGKFGGGFHELGRQVHSAHLAAADAGQIAGGAAQPGADVQQPVAAPRRQHRGQLLGGQAPAGVKLIHGGKVVGRQPVGVLPGRLQRREDPVDKSATAIMALDVFGVIGHWQRS